MLKLLRGDLRRMFKGKPFIICLIGLFIMSMGLALDKILHRIVYEQLEKTRPVSLFYYSFADILIVSLIAGLCTVFIVGWDFDGGNIKNKLVAGFSKLKIYLSTLVVSFIFGLIFLLLHYAVTTLCYGFSFGWEYIGRVFSDDWCSKLLIMAMIHSIFIVFYMVSLVCMIMMIFEKRIIGIILFVSVIVFTLNYGNDAYEYARATNENVVFYSIDDEGHAVNLQKEKNEYYLPDGDPLKIKSILIDSVNAPYASRFPIEVQTVESLFEPEPLTPTIVNYGRHLIGESVMIVIFGGLGYIVFKNRNLK